MNTIEKMKSQLIRRLLGRSYAESVAESKKPGKNGKAVAFLLKKKPKGVKMKGVRQEAKPVIIAEKPKPKKIVRPKPVRKLKRNAVAKSKTVDLEKERAKQREEQLKIAAASLTANLPTPSESGLDPNHNYKGLIDIIGRAGFCSSLENDILWTADGYNNSTVQVGAIKYKLDNKEDQKQFDSAVGKLVRWSGMADSLNNDDGNPPTTLNILHAIGREANLYSARQAKLKSSDDYLAMLVSKGTNIELKDIISSSKRDDVFKSMALAIAEIAVELGFKTNKAKSGYYITSSNKRFGATEISKKDIQPYFVEVIEGSKYYGKLSGSTIPGKLVEAVLYHLPI